MKDAKNDTNVQERVWKNGKVHINHLFAIMPDVVSIENVVVESTITQNTNTIKEPKHEVTNDVDIVNVKLVVVLIVVGPDPLVTAFSMCQRTQREGVSVTQQEEGRNH